MLREPARRNHGGRRLRHAALREIVGTELYTKAEYRRGLVEAYKRGVNVIGLGDYKPDAAADGILRDASPARVPGSVSEARVRQVGIAVRAVSSALAPLICEEDGTPVDDATYERIRVTWTNLVEAVARLPDGVLARPAPTEAVEPRNENLSAEEWAALGDLVKNPRPVSPALRAALAADASIAPAAPPRTEVDAAVERLTKWANGARPYEYERDMAAERQLQAAARTVLAALSKPTER